MRFIELHLEYGGMAVMVNLDTVTHFSPGDECTIIYFSGVGEGNYVEVRESYKAVCEAMKLSEGLLTP